MAGTYVRLNRTVMKRMGREASAAAAWRATQSAARLARENIAKKDRIATGEMLRSIKAEKVGYAKYKVGSDKSYAKYQEFGVRPFGPKRAKVLRFKPKRQNFYVFAHWVRGFEGAHFLRDALRSLSLSDWLP